MLVGTDRGQIRRDKERYNIDTGTISRYRKYMNEELSDTQMLYYRATRVENKPMRQIDQK